MRSLSCLFFIQGLSEATECSTEISYGRLRKVEGNYRLKCDSGYAPNKISFKVLFKILTRNISKMNYLYDFAILIYYGFSTVPLLIYTKFKKIEQRNFDFQLFFEIVLK